MGIEAQDSFGPSKWIFAVPAVIEALLARAKDPIADEDPIAGHRGAGKPAADRGAPPVFRLLGQSRNDSRLSPYSIPQRAPPLRPVVSSDGEA